MFTLRLRIVINDDRQCLFLIDINDIFYISFRLRLTNLKLEMWFILMLNRNRNLQSLSSS